MKMPKIQEIKKKLTPLLSQFDKDAGMFCVVLVGILFYGGLKFVVPGVSDIFSNLDKLSQKKETAESMQKRFALRNNKKTVKQEIISIKVFETSAQGLSLENAASSLKNQILNIIKTNGKNKILSLTFKDNQLTDKLGVKSKKYSILRMTIKMESKYENIQNIINEIYLLDHLVKIDSISLNIIQGTDNEVTKADLIFDLFIKKL